VNFEAKFIRLTDIFSNTKKQNILKMNKNRSPIKFVLGHTGENIEK
jgi:hypothetical protein